MGQVSVLKDENRDSEALKLKKGDTSYLSRDMICEVSAFSALAARWVTQKILNGVNGP